ncbi:MAG: PEP/pyruvate-binding domain-containing protein [Verrucomicrobiales bacterium]
MIRNHSPSLSGDLSRAVEWRWRTVAGVVVCSLVLAGFCSASEALVVGLEIRGVRPWIETSPLAGHRLRLLGSDDMRTWSERAQVNGRLFPYVDGPASGRFAGYYRIEVGPRQPSDDWSNQIEAGAPDLFKPGAGGGLSAISSVKWSLRLSDPGRVYFQDSVVYPYHIQFARARLPGYAGMGAVEFAAQSLYPGQSQRLALGSVFRAPDPQVRELGIELTGAAAFPAVQAVDWIDAVRQRLQAEPGWRLLYMPSLDQEVETRANLALFTARGIEVSSLRRWVTASTCYSEGWALGRLVRVAATEIPAALADGRLRLDDILVTDRVPAELPVLAGYLAFEPATPNSHVALLARSGLLPFAHAHGDGWQAEILSLLGREVLLVVEETQDGCRISLQDTTGRLTPERRQEILDSKRRPLAITPKTPRGALVVPVDPLTPPDIRYVGGKAANFGFLRRSLPDDSPHPALAMTFDLWDAYLAQPVPGGGTLGEFIDARLSRHTYPPDMNGLRADLTAIRHTVERTADFSIGQRTALADALLDAGLQGAKIRFRSSTNVEDGDTFNGAGLYDSFSGCLEDDLDGDDRGPSHCDPSEPNERGVFRALRKVYASFYNENAVLERLRYGVDESQVGMGVLVHFSSPDEIEMANGVATFAVDTRSGSRQTTARIVSQLGAESVTNPDGRFRPEVVRATFAGDDTAGTVFTLEESSSLTANGAPVMTWLDDYRTLVVQMHTAAAAYGAYYTEKTGFELDFEYKKLQPGRVGLKQIRAVPRLDPLPVPTIP